MSNIKITTVMTERGPVIIDGTERIERASRTERTLTTQSKRSNDYTLAV